jgi:hypothetical protein
MTRRDPVIDEFFGLLRVLSLCIRETEAKARRDLVSGIKSADASLKAIAKADDMILSAARDIAHEKVLPQNFTEEMTAFYASLEFLKK